MWGLFLDVLLSLSFFQYVVIPTRRSTAEAFQIVLSHLLGDAVSPYLIGVVRQSYKCTEKPFKVLLKRHLRLHVVCFFPPLGVRLDKAVRLIHVGVSFTSDVTPAVLLRGRGGRSFLPCYSPLHWERPPTGWELRPLWWVLSLMTSVFS